MSIVQLVKSDRSFQMRQRSDAETIEMPKEFTVVEAVPFRNKFNSVCERHFPAPPLKVSLDFSKTCFMDSSGIGALVSMVKTAKSAGILLAICGLTPQVEAVLTMTGLDRVLNIESEASSDALSVNDKSALLPVTHASVRSRTKRVIDVFGALVGLTLTGLLFIPIVIAIRSDGPGPFFFCQTRRGWMGREFKCWKFRSMVLNAEALKNQVENEAQGAIFKAKNDPRVTKVGHLLRRTSIDELPQFWNVLLGSMSLVGTRPPTAGEVDQYDVPEWRRLDVKPGITGEWQVHGRSSVKCFEDIIRLDLRYQRNWSLLYDFKLIFKTVVVIFSKDSGAM